MSSQSSVDIDQMPVVSDVRDFDSASGNWLERLIFNHRMAIVLLTVFISVFLAWHGSNLNP